MSHSVAISVFSVRGWGEGKGGCVRNTGHEHDFCQAQKAENTDPRTNHAVKSATARGHLTTRASMAQGKSTFSCSCFLWDPGSGMTPKWGFGVAMLPVGALRFYQAHFGRTVLPKWPLWAHLFYSVFIVFQSLGGHASARRLSRDPCFCQAHCFVQGPLRFLPVPPNPTCAHSHIWGLPSFCLVWEGRGSKMSAH